MTAQALSHRTLAFVDLETTGGTATADRITEIGIVEVDEAGVREWSCLVNPGTPIPFFIQRLTGITDEMVREAPTFAELAGEVLERLEGRLFIAHNARFDYGFLRSEFERAGHRFRATVLCTVKLSRRLFPQHHRHNLDALIERHGLHAAGRHRALADAQLIYQFWRQVRQSQPEEVLATLVDELTARPRLPAQIDPDVVDDLPASPGVFLFFGDDDAPLYVGRAKDIKQRVLARLAGDATAKNSLVWQVRRIDWIVTGGEIGARLKEAALVMTLRPRHNRLARDQGDHRGTETSVAPWPYAGPAVLREGEDLHVIDRWRHLGTARSDEELWTILEQSRPPFDHDIYQILARVVAKLEPLPSKRLE